MQAGIRLVVGDVGQEADVPDTIDINMLLALGSVYADPRPVRTDVVGAGAPVIQARELPEQDPLPQPRSSRDFLRRAL